MNEGYEDYLWKIDNQHPQVRFAESSVWLDKGILNEKKIINVHNRDIRKAFEKGQMSKGIFTTSMNRKVCWENGFEKGKQEAQDIFKEKLKIAKQCVNFQLIRCDNKDCLNWACVLNEGGKGEK